MPGYDDPRTRATERVEGHDPHAPLGAPEFSDILNTDQARADALERAKIGTGAELSAQAEVLQNDVLDALARAQTTALRETMIAVDPTLTGVEDEALVDTFLDLQLSDPNQALTIMNDSIARATAIIEARGYNSNTIVTAFARAGASARDNMLGVGEDLAQTNMGSAAQNLSQGNFSGSLENLRQMDVSGILTVLLAGGAGWRVVGPKTGFGLAAFATILQNQHLTDLTINAASGVARAATQAAALPIRGGMRTVDIINSIGQSGFTESLVNNGVGFGNDIANSIGYTFDGDYSPNNILSGNPMLQEFYEEGERFTPGPLSPFVLYLKEIRNGGPITALPSEAQAREAGAFIAQIESLVTLDEFTAIQEKRITGKNLTADENRKYILYKYCMIVNANFIGDTGMLPYAEAMTQAHENETGSIVNLEQAFASLSPDQLNNLDKANFSWDAEKVASFQAQIKAQTEGLSINFENLTKNGGFVGVALTAYIALTYAGAVVQLSRGSWNTSASAFRKVINNVKTVDRRLFPAELSKQVVSALDNDKNRLSDVISPLVGGKVLANKKDFARALRRTSLSDINETARNRFKLVVKNKNATTAEVRNAFFTLLENSGVTIDKEAMTQRRDFYRYREAMSQISNFYSYDKRNTDREITIGNSPLFIGRPKKKNFSFSDKDLLKSRKVPGKFYEYMDTEHALKFKNRAGEDVVLNLRRKNNHYQYRIEPTSDWANFDLNDFASSVSSSLQPAAVEGTPR